MIAGLIVLFFIIVVLTAINNNSAIRLMDKQTTLHQNIWHFTSALIRGLLVLVILYQSFGCFTETVRLWVLAQLFWWVFFDSILNRLRGRSLLYVGQTDIIDKSIRAVAGKIKIAPELTGILIKLICILLILLV